MNVIGGGAHGREHGLIGGGPIDEQGHTIARDEGTPTEALFGVDKLAQMHRARRMVLSQMFI
jgi:hypothetical protein